MQRRGSSRRSAADRYSSAAIFGRQRFARRQNRLVGVERRGAKASGRGPLHYVYPRASSSNVEPVMTGHGVGAGFKF